MVPELVSLHWGLMGYEPVHSCSDRAQVSAHHWPNDRPTDKAPQSRDVDNDARPETDRQVGYAVASLFQPPGNSRGRFVYCTNFEVVTDTVDPSCETTVVSPPASVADLIYRCFSRPLDNNVALAEGMNQLEVTRSRDDIPDFVLLGDDRTHDRKAWGKSLSRGTVIHRFVFHVLGSRSATPLDPGYLSYNRRVSSNVLRRERRSRTEDMPYRASPGSRAVT